MFRRLSSTLPKDPEFPANLEKLGYFITTDDQIRSIAKPTQEFHFWISKNERVCEMQREAFNTCIRTNLSTRFTAAGLQTTRLPPTASPTDPHIPILTTANLSTAPRILLYFGETLQDLGIFAYRTIGRDTLASGSVLDFVSAIQAQAQASVKGGGDVAIVIANLGQSTWYRRGKRAMTTATWMALPRKTGVDAGMRLDPVRNKVEGHRDAKEHVASVMEYVHGRMKEGAMVEIVGVGEGAEEIVGFLDGGWKQWEGSVSAICVGLGFVWRVKDEVKDEGLRQFWGKRAHAYLVHSTPLDTPLYGRQDIGCNCHSSGESMHVECIMPSAYKSMLNFFQLVHDLPGYEETPLEVEMDEEDGGDRVVKWEEGRDAEVLEEMSKALVEVSKTE